MSEKKRFRPTLGQYREQQKEIDSLNIIIDELEKKCDDLQSKHEQDLHRIEEFEHNDSSECVSKVEYDTLREKYLKIETKLRASEVSNQHLYDECERVRKYLDDERNDKTLYMKLWEELKNRNLWQRIINKKQDYSIPNRG